MAVPGARSAAAPPALRPLRCSRPGPLCLRAVPKYSGKKKKYRFELKTALELLSSTGGREPAAIPGTSPGSGAPSGAGRPKSPARPGGAGHGRGHRGSSGELGGCWLRASPLLAPLRAWGGGGGRGGLPLRTYRSAPPGARTARLRSERRPAGCGGAEGRKLNSERELRKKEVAREGINSIQLANGAGASPRAASRPIAGASGRSVGLSPGRSRRAGSEPRGSHGPQRLGRGRTPHGGPGSSRRLPAARARVSRCLSP